MPDPFGRLPLEIQERILLYLPDLPSVCRIAVASGAMAEASTSRALLVPFIERMPHFLREVVAEVLRLLYTKELADCIEGDAPHCLLLLARRIEYLTTDFLRIHIGRSNRLYLEVPPNDRVRFLWKLERDGRTLKSYPEGRQWKFAPAEQADWYETARVRLSLWLAQLQSIRRLSGFSGSGEDNVGPHQDRIAAVLTYLEESGISLPNVRINKLWIQLARWRSVSSRPVEHLDNEINANDSPVWSASFIRQKICHGSFHHSLRCSPTAYMNLVYGLNWKPYGRLGLSMWSYDRLCRMGICDSDMPGRRFCTECGGTCRDHGHGIGLSLSPSSRIFVWRSMILDGERLSPDPRDSSRWPRTNLSDYHSVRRLIWRRDNDEPQHADSTRTLRLCNTFSWMF